MVAASPREGWPPEGARRWAFDSGSTRSATARPRAAGTRPKESAKHDQPPTPCQPAAQRRLHATLAPPGLNDLVTAQSLSPLGRAGLDSLPELRIGHDARCPDGHHRPGHQIAQRDLDGLIRRLCTEQWLERAPQRCLLARPLVTHLAQAVGHLLQHDRRPRRSVAGLRIGDHRRRFCSLCCRASLDRFLRCSWLHFLAHRLLRRGLLRCDLLRNGCLGDGLGSSLLGRRLLRSSLLGGGRRWTRRSSRDDLLNHRFSRTRVAMLAHRAYFSPSWTPFQADRGRDFSVIVDGVSV